MDMNDAEKKIMREHFLYWKGREDKGDVLLFGPVTRLVPMAWASSRRTMKRVHVPLRRAIRR